MRHRLLIALIACAAMTAMAPRQAALAQATDVVIVESHQPSGALTPDPPYKDVGFFDTTSKSTAPGLTGVGSRYGCAAAMEGYISVNPALNVPGGKYHVDVTLSAAAGNVSSDLVAAVAATGGTGLPATTTAFRSSTSNTWVRVGDIQLDPGVTSPKITFTYSSGTVDCTAQMRWISDAYRFSLVRPCEEIPLVSVTGPFEGGETTVEVTGISASATLATVYSISDGVPSVIGSANPGGSTTCSVPVVSIVPGTKIAATQTIGGQEGCTPTTGVAVGPVIVESQLGGQNFNRYTESGAWSTSSVKSSAPGTTGGIGSRFGTANTSAFTVSPVLKTAGGKYRVDITHTSVDSNTSPDIVVTVGQTNCTGLPATTTLFQRGSAAKSPAWGALGEIQLDAGQTTPSITFTYSSGTIGSVGGRFWADAVRFVKVTECLQVPEVVVEGPMDAGQTTVRISGIQTGAEAATNVTVYSLTATGINPIGSANPGGEAAIDVPVTALVKGAHIGATQTVGGIEGCQPTTGPLVGSGPNTAILLSLGIRETNAGGGGGPIGADGGLGSSSIEWLGAAGAAGGAPAGKLVAPSNQWQTLTFSAANSGGKDPVLSFNAGDGVLQGDFGVLEHLAIVSAANARGTRDVGHYRLYIDNISNGATNFADFESYDADTAVMFLQPSYSGSTATNLLGVPDAAVPAGFRGTPDFAAVDAATGDGSSKSERVEFQFIDASPGRWVRLTTYYNPAISPPMATRPLQNPYVDLRQPITLRVLLQPVASDTTLTLTGPESKTANEGDNVSFSVSASGGTGTIHYKWYRDGYEVAGSDSPVFTLSNLSVSDAGSVRVCATDDKGTVYSAEAALTVNVLPLVAGAAKQKPDGSSATIAGSLVVTKTGGTEFWAQAQDRSAGIRVVSTANPPINQLVSGIQGTVKTDPATTEKFIEVGAGAITVGSEMTPEPLQTLQRSIGGDNVTGGAGLPDDGLLVTVVGKVTAIDYTTNVFYIEDGSNVANDTPTSAGAMPPSTKVAGIKVLSDGSAMPYATGMAVGVTGIVRLEAAGGNVIRKIEMRNEMDLDFDP